MRIITAAEFRKGQWRNGRGVSWDIYSEGAAGAEEFGWRLSLADIAESGPFSLYGPVDRVFTLIEGKGLALDISGAAPAAPAIYKPLAFACDVKTSCTLAGGPCRALNLFTARGEWSAEGSVIDIAEIEDLDASGKACALYILEGDCSVAAHGTVTVAAAGEAVIIPAPAGVLSIAGKNSKVFAGLLTKL
jgi:uncharacterized protein